MANESYPAGKLELWNNVVSNLTYKAMLVDDTYTFNADENDISTAASSEVSGTGDYARLTCSSLNFSEDGSKIMFDLADLSWTNYQAGETYGLIIFIEYSTSDDTQNIPLFFFDQGFPLNTNGGELQVVSNDTYWYSV